MLAAGYTETGFDAFSVTTYWGWSSFPEIEFELGLEFAEQFEDQYLVKNYPPDSPNPDWIVINEVYADPSPGLFGDADKDCFMIRVPDGEGDWRLPMGGEPVLSPNERNVGQSGQLYLLINEVLADPPPGIDGDANGDGYRSSSGDDFVEIYNYGDEAADLWGVKIADDSGAFFSIPESVIVPAGGFLYDRYDSLLDEVEWPGTGYEGGINTSMIRVPDFTGDWENSLPPLPPYTPCALNSE